MIINKPTDLDVSIDINSNYKAIQITSIEINDRKKKEGQL